MKMVFALGGNEAGQRIINGERPPNLLISQVYRKALTTLQYAPDYFLLDSGAFTAWNAGKVVDRAEYATFSQSVMLKIPHTWVINLDVIPGEKGRSATRDEMKAGMENSLLNATYLRGFGLPVVEVFHQDEPFAFLDTLLERRPDANAVVGLSPRNDVSIKSRCDWMKGVLGYLVKRHGVKNIPRFHGLAVTSTQMLKSFPFYSVDSSSWATAYVYGTEVTHNGGRTASDSKSYSLPHSRNKDGLDLLTRRAVRNFMKVGDDITRLWELRGVVFRD